MSWEDYGISKYRYQEKKEKLRYGLSGMGFDAMPGSGKIGKPTESMALHNNGLSLDCDMIEKAAAEADPILYRWILKSVTEDKSYEDIEYLENWGRIPVCRQDFYGIRRKFYAILNRKKK